MNIVFFGSSNFAVPSLRALITSGHRISCVVTQPDKQKGRGLHLEGTLVKTEAFASGLKIYQPPNINTNEAIEFLKSLSADLFIVIAYGQILSQRVLDIPRIFAINIHASLLPKYRGAAPINWALIHGEETTGITVMKMTEQMDAGPIIMQSQLDILKDDTALTLEEKLSDLGTKILLQPLKDIENNNYKLVPQDESRASFAPKLKKEDGLINWNKPAQDIYNLIRGCINWPGAFTHYKGKLLKIYKSKVRQCASAPVRQLPIAGEITHVSKNSIEVATGNDNLIIQELQIEGKRRMNIEEFIAGHKICAGEILGKK